LQDLLKSKIYIYSQLYILSFFDCLTDRLEVLFLLYIQYYFYSILYILSNYGGNFNVKNKQRIIEKRL